MNNGAIGGVLAANYVISHPLKESIAVDKDIAYEVYDLDNKFMKYLVNNKDKVLTCERCHKKVVMFGHYEEKHKIWLFGRHAGWW